MSSGGFGKSGGGTPVQQGGFLTYASVFESHIMNRTDSARIVLPSFPAGTTDRGLNCDSVFISGCIELQKNVLPILIPHISGNITASDNDMAVFFWLSIGSIVLSLQHYKVYDKTFSDVGTIVFWCVNEKKINLSYHG